MVTLAAPKSVRTNAMQFDIHKVGVIGAGQMGNGIAHVCALSGFSVLLNDIALGNGDRAAERMRSHVQDFEAAMHRVLVAV